MKLAYLWIDKYIKTGEDYVFLTSDPLQISVEFENLLEGQTTLDITIHLQDERNNLVFVTSTINKEFDDLLPGRYISTCNIPGNLLNQGTYTVTRMLFVKDRGRVIFEHNNTLTFDVIFPQSKTFGWMGKKEGVVRPELEWSLRKFD